MSTKILIIDDDIRLLDALAFELEDQGFDVTTQQTGKNCLKTIQEHNVQLILSDIFMPEVDGIEVLTALRRARPDLPIFLMSGGSRINNMNYDTIFEQAQLLGARKIFKKPFDVKELVMAVQEFT
jgi:DNA-binding NtrC family response regulator